MWVPSQAPKNKPWYEACPDVGAPGMPIFDTHCHLDRLFLEDRFREAVGWRDPLYVTPDPLGFLTTKFPDAFGSNFKGCITNGCDPKSWYHTSVYEKFAKAKGNYNLLCIALLPVKQPRSAVHKGF